jgi:transcriptional regulator with XRE-family HTH domain
MLTPNLARQPQPAQIAANIAETHSPGAIRSIIRHLDQSLGRAGLERFTQLWDLSGAEAARLFGVTRQALAQWLRDGPPRERTAAIAALEDTTDLLARYIKRERIPIVVRRPADLLGGRSLLELVQRGKYQQALDGARRMLDLRRIES